MKFKKTMLFVLLLVCLLTMSVVSAASDNTLASDTKGDISTTPDVVGSTNDNDNSKSNLNEFESRNIEDSAEPIKEKTGQNKKLSSSADEDVLNEHFSGNGYDLDIDVNNITTNDQDHVFDIDSSMPGTYDVFIDVKDERLLANPSSNAIISGQKLEPADYGVRQLGFETVYSLKLTSGKHLLTIFYTPRDEINYGSRTLIFNNTITYLRVDLQAPPISIGENGIINVILPKDANGDVTVYAKDKWGYGKSLGIYNILNGIVSINVGKLSEQYNEFQLNFKTNLGNFNETATIVANRYDDISLTVTPTVFVVGKSATVTFNSRYRYNANIYVDDVFYGSYNDVTSFKKVISGLSVGTHKIKVTASDSNGVYTYTKTFTKTFFITVKKTTTKISLKKVTIRKSAKKIVLKATLKINNKVAKSKKVTFTFNGKKYTKNTNSKGIAKVTIKKATLKKLKVGKKITYKASYSKTTAKRTVKVKK